jgi:hypothetical protein
MFVQSVEQGPEKAVYPRRMEQAIVATFWLESLNLGRSLSQHFSAGKDF